MEDTEDEFEDPPDSEWAAALAWLPVDMQKEVEALLTADRRIAQEATGWEFSAKRKEFNWVAFETWAEGVDD